MLLVATRCGRIAADDWPRIRNALEALPIDVGPELASRVLHTVLPVASEYKLSAYDARYLELALRLGQSLATLDKKLIDAANSAGIKLLGS